MENQNITIRPAVSLLNGQLVESYERKTNASPEQLEAVGLDPNEEYYSKIGTSPVTEYVRLIGKYLQSGDTQRWDIAKVGQMLEIDNIYIDAPNQDSFDLEIYDLNNEKLLDLTVSRNKSPLELPNAPLTTDLSLVIRARNTINTVVVICRPAVLLADFLSNELEEYWNNQGA